MEERVQNLFRYLPGEILGCIVSFLPNEYALETSLISTRWRDLWNQVLVKHGTIEDILLSYIIMEKFSSCKLLLIKKKS